MSALPELPDASRVAFEAWLAIKDPRPFTPDAYSDQDYKWRGWQASRKQALEEAMQACRDVEEPGWTGYECPNTFSDGQYAAEAAIKELLK